MRKYMALVVLCVLGLLPSVSKAGVDARTAVQTAKPPTLKCSVVSVRLIGTSVVATGGCKFGTTPAPAKWSWVQRSSDLSGSPCQFGSGKGTSKRSNLLAYPAGVSRISGPAIPGLVDAAFTVTAKWGKRTAKATRSFQKRTPNSHVLCGAPPKLVSLDGPEPSALTWASPPAFDGTSLRAGTIQSRGNGQCRWKSPTFQRQGGYLTHKTSDFVCANGYQGSTGIHVYYFVGDKQKCDRPFDGVSSFAVPLSWGLGRLGFQVGIATNNGSQWLPYNSDNFWQTSSWVEALGNIDPCLVDLQ